ncbi:MAG: hypothetical protein M3Y81_10395 [Chloroflexota bacterium]|nr:hypothetical protein [Chloroflexota bacterium]
MPMSAEAAAGLRAAVEWNPSGARYLLDILRDLPIGVRYKEQDRYGPLAMMLSASQPTRQITREVSIPVRSEPLSAEKLKACEVFNTEWLQRRFTKQELAEAIERILAEVEPGPMLEEVAPGTEIVFTAEGTFLQRPEQEPEALT